MRWVIIDPILQIIKLRLRDGQICVLYRLEVSEPRKGIPVEEDMPLPKAEKQSNASTTHVKNTFQFPLTDT